MRRRAILAALCLLGGAAVSVLIAWACALWSAPTRLISPLTFEESRAMFAGQFGAGRYFDRTRQPGTRGDLLLITPPPAPEQTLDEREAYWIQGSAIDFVGYRCTGAWDDLRGPSPQVLQYRAGWPLYCVRGVQAKFPARNIDRSRGWFAVRGSIGPFQILGQRHLPFLPVWPGLLASSIGYGSILWLMLAAPFELRRRWRRRRGLCIECGYDLRGIDSQKCPECGAAVDQSRARQEAARSAQIDAVTVPSRSRL